MKSERVIAQSTGDTFRMGQVVAQRKRDREDVAPIVTQSPPQLWTGVRFPTRGPEIIFGLGQSAFEIEIPGF